MISSCKDQIKLYLYLNLVNRSFFNSMCFVAGFIFVSPQWIDFVVDYMCGSSLYNRPESFANATDELAVEAASSQTIKANINTEYKTQQIKTLILTLVGIACVVTIVTILFLHVVSPLYCALHTIGDEGNVNWVSTCQFFVWRMMTRSTVVRSFTYRLINHNTKQVDYINPESLGMRGTQGLAYYEDMLLEIAHRIGSHAISATSDQTPPAIYADIWVEINGPPIQRYINVSVDLMKETIVQQNVS